MSMSPRGDSAASASICCVPEPTVTVAPLTWILFIRETSRMTPVVFE